MRKRDRKKFPIISELMVAEFALATKMKLAECKRCGSTDIFPYVSNEAPPVFHTDCGVCGIRTRGWLSMQYAIWDWNGVFLRERRK